MTAETFGVGVTRAVTVSGTNILASIDTNGAYISTNNGANWVHTPLNNQTVFGVTANSTNVFAATADGIYVSTNNGTNRVLRNEGFGTSAPAALSFSLGYNYILVGTSENGIWKQPLSDFVGIKMISNNIPDKYSLHQNYPNQFNPSTLIRYEITNSNSNEFVVLKIYDVLGKKINTLVNEKQSPGIYEATFDGTSLTSGVYFYKLTVGNYSVTKKMLIN